MQMASEVVGGPTAQGQPPFTWGDRFPEFAHVGMPDRFDFSFERQAPADMPLGEECSQQQPAAAAAAAAGAALQVPGSALAAPLLEQL
jgi:hypothetical protein